MAIFFILGTGFLALFCIIIVVFFLMCQCLSLYSMQWRWYKRATKEPMCFILSLILINIRKLFLDCNSCFTKPIARKQMSTITNRNDWKRWTLATSGGGPNKNLPLDNLKISPFMPPSENTRLVSKYNPAISSQEEAVEEEDTNLHINSGKSGRTCNLNPLDWIKFMIKFILWVALILVSIRVIYSSFPVRRFTVSNNSDAGGNSRGSTSLTRDNHLSKEI